MGKTKIDWDMILPIGADQAISGEELTRRLGFENKRDTRQAVLEARLDGTPICSLQGENGGYFLPGDDWEEVRHSMNELRKRAITSLRSAACLNKWLKQNGHDGFDGQMVLDDFEKEEKIKRNKIRSGII